MFGIAYLYAIVSIMMDINKSGKDYDRMIADDLSEIKMMGLSGRMAEFEAELTIRMSGAKANEGMDDQLLDEAMRLSTDQYKKHM